MDPEKRARVESQETFIAFSEKVITANCANLSPTDSHSTAVERAMRDQ